MLLDQLVLDMQAAVASEGRAIFLLGSAGSGKTALLGVLQELAYRSHRDLEAQNVDCAQSGEKTWLELARLFTRGHRLKRSAAKVAMEWLDVTQIGAVFTAAWRTVKAVRTKEVPEADSRGRRSPTDTATEAVRLLMEYGSLDPRLIILDSLDRGDNEDLTGAFALIQRLASTRTLFVAAVRSKEGRLPTAIGDLILEAERLGVGRRIELPALSIDEVREAVESATRGAVPVEWLDWLVGQSRGVPGTLWSTLGGLERGGTLRRSGRRWSWEGNPDEAVGGRTQATVDVSGLEDEDMRILSLAAVEGHRFHSSVLAELSGVPELDLEDRLSRLCRRGLLEYCGEVAAGADVTSSYAFRSPSDANVFASGCPDADRPALTARIQSIYQRLGLPADLD